MTEAVSAELFIIGNELLIGEIQDTNTSWLCHELHNLGGMVTRATVLRDNLDVIAAELRHALARSPRVIMVSGGLGPTIDDLTLAAVAVGTGRELCLNETALAMIRQRYDEFTAQGILSEGGLNPAREKMAWLPAGALPLHNPVGTAPAVRLEIGATTIICLPGVPSELRGIFATSLQPFLGETFRRGTAILRTIIVRCNDESVMEPVLSRTVRDHPQIYLKSLATTLGENREIDVTVTAVGCDDAGLESLVTAAMDDLKSGIEQLGITWRNKERTP
jgi:molybdenum cofactor synthesis domain-containing protein